MTIKEIIGNFKKPSQGHYVLIALICSFLTYWIDIPVMITIAQVISDIFVDILRLISVPIVFLSVISTLSGLENIREFRSLGLKVIFYTIITTIISISIALTIYLLVSPADPSIGTLVADEQLPNAISAGGSYSEYLRGLVPQNFVKTFLDNNVIGVIIIAFLMGAGVILLEDSRKRILLNDIFQALFETIVKIASILVSIMPVMVWSFFTVFLYKSGGTDVAMALGWFIFVILTTISLHAFVFLPLLLKIKTGLSPIQVFKHAFPALTVAFFTGSSSAALPTTINCAIENIKLSKRVSNFTLPICATINMNGCAAFILIATMFVFECNGINLTFIDIMMWMMMALVGAIGNAGVPMGCYFMATTFLVAMEMPLDIMIIFLPFHRFLDMYETMINVWSDVCVACVIDETEGDKRNIK